MPVTLAQLRAIAPHAPGDDLPELNAAMAEFGIDTPFRQAMFLAQLALECDQFRVFAEVWGPTSDQIHYERPVVNGVPAPLVDGPHKPLWQRLGNLNPGDGRRYCGHGGIQLTGAENHRLCGEDLGVDLVAQPGLAESPALRYRVSGWYWQRHGLGPLADVGDVVAVTRAINGPGMYGLRQRQAFYALALPALATEAESPPSV